MDSKFVLVLIATLFNWNTQIMGDSLNEFAETGMKGWEIHDYGGINSLQLNTNISAPKVKSKSDVLVEVYATSINPLDKLMTGSEFFFHSSKCYFILLLKNSSWIWTTRIEHTSLG